MYSTATLLKVDFHFDQPSELTAGFQHLYDTLSSLDPTGFCEIDLKIHWQKHLLNSEYHKAIIAEIQKLQSAFPKVALICYLPHCFTDKLNLTSFPNCMDCALFEARWCKWPSQMGTKYYLTGQKDCRTLDPSKLNNQDFAGPVPVTWITPDRATVALASRVLSQCPQIIDFGCGNGFIDLLLLNEGLKSPIYGVDPLVDPELDHPGFIYRKSVPEQSILRDGYALVSSLADFNVPVETCFQGQLPDVAVFFAFPEVFGFGGQRVHLRLEKSKKSILKTEHVFAFSDLEWLGYECLYTKPIHTHHLERAEFKIYVRGESLISEIKNKMSSWVKETSLLTPYPWEENTELTKNAPISVLDLS